MRKRGLAVMVCVMMLAAGCSSGQSHTTIEGVGIHSEEETETETGLFPSAGEQASVSLEGSLAYLEESVRAADESLDAREESLKMLEEALKKKEEALDTETGDSGNGTSNYTALTMFPEEFKGRKVVLTGRVVQAAALSSSTIQLLLAVNGNDATRMVGEYPSALLQFSLEHGDIVTVTGKYAGVMRYRQSTGERLDLPTVQIAQLVREEDGEAAFSTTEAAETLIVPTSPAYPETETETEPQTQSAAQETTSAPPGPGEMDWGQQQTGGQPQGPGTAQGAGQAGGPGTSAGSAPSGPGGLPTTAPAGPGR